MRASVFAFAGVAVAVAVAPAPVGVAADRAFERAVNQASTCPVGGYQASAGFLGCLGERLGGVFVDQAASMLVRQGREVFGENFRLVPGWSWSPGGGGLAGDIDMVVPLVSHGVGPAAGRPEHRRRHALFLQQGLTRWTDARGFRRNDVRTGVGYRTALPHSRGAVLGTSVLIQKSMEVGHQRLVIGADSAGRWGRVWLQHFVPTTGWRPSLLRGPRSEERAIGGTDVRASLHVTSTVGIDVAASRWERRDGGRPAVDSHWNLSWRPHPWVRMEAGYREGTEVGADGGSVMLLMTFPLGISPARLRWTGPDRFASTAALPDLWRPVDKIGPIRTVQRLTGENVQELQIGPLQAEARFLQSRAETGSAIDVEVRLSEPVGEAIELIVRLVPGSGNNPAVPGADYVDVPARATIGEGSTTARVSFRLLENPDLAADRTLAVRVSLVP